MTALSAAAASSASGPAALASALAQDARAMGAAAFGVADLEALQEKVPALLERVPGAFRRAVVVGFHLQRAVLAEIEDQPTALYFHHYRQVNYQLDRIALLAADRLQAAGYRALAIPASQIIERAPMRGHVSHRLLGWAAGLGHLGRQGLLVHPRYGSQVRYVSTLTDAALPAGAPTEATCGSCRACIRVCPAGAIKEDREAFDLAACEAKLTEFTKLPTIGQHICGVCLKACPGRGGDSRSRGAAGH